MDCDAVGWGKELRALGNSDFFFFLSSDLLHLKFYHFSLGLVSSSRCVWKMRRNLHVVVVGHQGLSPRSAGNWTMTMVKGRPSSQRRTGDWELYLAESSRFQNDGGNLVVWCGRVLWLQRPDWVCLVQEIEPELPGGGEGLPEIGSTRLDCSCASCLG